MLGCDPLAVSCFSGVASKSRSLVIYHDTAGLTAFVLVILLFFGGTQKSAVVCRSRVKTGGSIMGMVEDNRHCVRHKYGVAINNAQLSLHAV